MNAQPEPFITLDAAIAEHPDAFAYARSIWERDGGTWGELELAFFKQGEELYGIGAIVFALYPKNVLAAHRDGEEVPGGYKWISAELPLVYTADDFIEGDGDTFLDGIILVHE